MGTRELVPVIAKVPNPRSKDQPIQEQRNLAARTHRERLRNWMQAHGLFTRRLCEAAEHVFAELLSNANDHGGGLVDCVFRVEGDCLFLGVTDANPIGEPKPRKPGAGAKPIHGYGLYIAITLAAPAEWGWTVNVREGTKEVFFMIPLNI